MQKKDIEKILKMSQSLVNRVFLPKDKPSNNNAYDIVSKNEPINEYKPHSYLSNQGLEISNKKKVLKILAKKNDEVIEIATATFNNKKEEEAWYTWFLTKIKDECMEYISNGYEIEVKELKKVL